MINVVTWLDSNKYRSEISAVCAGNGIRIVADEFEGAQDFLRTFDSIDANIDVLVIANSNLENIDDGKMSSIKTDDISVEGFRDWKMKVVPSNELVTKKIYNKAQPHDSDTESHWYRQYNLYYHGLEDVIITVDGEQHSLAHALKRGKFCIRDVYISLRHRNTSKFFILQM